MAVNLRFLLATLMMVSAPALAQQAVPATPSGPVYVVTYFEAGPAAANAVAGTLKQFAAATRKEDGNQDKPVRGNVDCRPVHPCRSRNAPVFNQPRGHPCRTPSPDR